MNVSRYKCSVLVVDDEPDVLAVLAAQLAGDFEVLTAPDAAGARAALAERSVEIVISDLNLPDESGLDLLEWVRRTAPRTARVLLTGANQLDFAVDAINQCQVHRLVLKPWRPEDLIQSLRTISRSLLLERSHEQILDELRRLNLELERR
ncbi:MAG: response regulator, partial [Gemmataceae bacterium]|nr:response regulator [Gemmataceae bacterium]